MKYLARYWMFTLIVMLISTTCLEADQREGQKLTIDDKMFFLQLKHALESNDRAWIANHISLPLNITIDGKRRMITTRQEILDKFELIFNKRVRDAIESQHVDNLFKNWRGIMVGRGEIWFLAVCPDPKNLDIVEYYIIGINN